jgi:hypothetical protein
MAIIFASGLRTAITVLMLGTGASLHMPGALAGEVDMSQEGQGDENSVTFASPSRNIFCGYSGMDEQFACERIKPSYLGAALGTGSVETFTESRFLKSAFNDGGPSTFVLQYGKTWKAKGSSNGITCTSLKTGMRCKDNSGGFILSKKSLQIF